MKEYNLDIAIDTLSMEKTFPPLWRILSENLSVESGDIEPLKAMLWARELYDNHILTLDDIDAKKLKSFIIDPLPSSPQNPVKGQRRFFNIVTEALIKALDNGVEIKKPSKDK